MRSGPAVVKAQAVDGQVQRATTKISAALDTAAVRVETTLADAVDRVEDKVVARAQRLLGPLGGAMAFWRGAQSALDMMRAAAAARNQG